MLLLPKSYPNSRHQLRFKFRGGAQNFLSYNFPQKIPKEFCECKTQLTNEHILTCEVINNGRKHQFNYNQLLNGSISEQEKCIAS